MRMTDQLEKAVNANPAYTCFVFLLLSEAMALILFKGSEARLKNAEARLETVLEQQLDAALLEESGGEADEEDECELRRMHGVSF
jgi:hypothetical protein